MIGLGLFMNSCTVCRCILSNLVGSFLSGEDVVFVSNTYLVYLMVAIFLWFSLMGGVLSAVLKPERSLRLEISLKLADYDVLCLSFCAN